MRLPRLQLPNFSNGSRRRFSTASRAAATPSISPSISEIAQHAAYFREQGYVASLPIFSPAEISELRTHIFREHRHCTDSDGRFPPQFVNLCWADEHLWDKVVMNPVLVRHAQAFFGTEDILHLSTTMFSKYGPRASLSPEEDPPKRVGWHQDLYFWNLHPPASVTFWIALFPTTVENGCLHVVPLDKMPPTWKPPQTSELTFPRTGTPFSTSAPSEGGVASASDAVSCDATAPSPNNEHTTTSIFVEHRTDSADKSNVLMGYQDVPPHVFGGERNAVALCLEEGHASAHSGFTIHGSPPNLAPPHDHGDGQSNLRAGLTVQYVPARTEVMEFLYNDLVSGRNFADQSDDGDWRLPCLVAGRDVLGPRRAGMGLLEKPF